MSVFAKVEKLFPATQGVGNTQVAFIYGDVESAKKAAEIYGYLTLNYDWHEGTVFAMRRQACFAVPSTVNKCMESLKYVVYDITNVQKCYKTDEGFDAIAHEMAYHLYHLPYVKKHVVNKSFNDAMKKGLRIRVDQKMTNEELFLPMYLLRHVWERRAYKGYAWLLKNTKLTKREAALFALTFFMSSRGELLWQNAGHSAVDMLGSFNPEYFFNMVNGGVPDFKKFGKKLLRSSPNINLLMGGVRVNGFNLPFNTVGDGWNRKYLADVPALLLMYSKFKKKVKNVKPA